MKREKSLGKLFFTKEKAIFLLIIFILINISLFMNYQDSIYSDPEYQSLYPQAGLDLYYYIHTIGISPIFFMLMMLLMPNLVSYDFLTIHQSHASYQIETRIGKKRYYLSSFMKNILLSALVVFIIEVLIVFIIHCFYIPLQFNTMEYPELYYAKTQILASHEGISLIAFILLTSFGYSLISALIFPLQILITNKYIYRCFGVLFGILLVLFPALIQGYLPFPDAAFILQINNIVALGMENVRLNPFGLSHLHLYLLCFLIYSLITYIAYHFLLKWRQCYD